jgi:hypothetical protein
MGLEGIEHCISSMGTLGLASRWLPPPQMPSPHAPRWLWLHDFACTAVVDGTGEVPPPSPNPSDYHIFGLLGQRHRPGGSRASKRAKVSLPCLPCS